MDPADSWSSGTLETWAGALARADTETRRHLLHGIRDGAHRLLADSSGRSELGSTRAQAFLAVASATLDLARLEAGAARQKAVDAAVACLEQAGAVAEGASPDESAALTRAIGDVVHAADDLLVPEDLDRLGVDRARPARPARPAGPEGRTP